MQQQRLFEATANERGIVSLGEVRTVELTVGQIGDIRIAIDIYQKHIRDKHLKREKNEEIRAIYESIIKKYTKLSDYLKDVEWERNK